MKWSSQLRCAAQPPLMRDLRFASTSSRKKDYHENTKRWKHEKGLKDWWMIIEQWPVFAKASAVAEAMPWPRRAGIFVLLRQANVKWRMSNDQWQMNTKLQVELNNVLSPTWKHMRSTVYLARRKKPEIPRSIVGRFPTHDGQVHNFNTIKSRPR